VLTPEVTAGPYYIANHLFRRDITEKQPGLPLALHLEVQGAVTCKPIEGANVEIWHARRPRDLRHDLPWLVSGACAAHPHQGARRRLGRAYGPALLRGPDERCGVPHGHYRSHGQPDTTDAAGSSYKQAGAASELVRLSKQAGGSGYVGAKTLGIRV
jgi:hypothetical protein